MAGENDEYLFPKFILAAIPAGFAWQVYGWKAGLAVYLLLYFALIALSWARFYWDWSFRRLVWTRTVMLVLAYVLISISSMETCSPDLSVCRSVFSPASP